MDEDLILRFEYAMDAVAAAGTAQQRGGAVYAIRNLLVQSQTLANILRQPPVASVAEAALGGQAWLVSAIMFDKVPEANWKVPAHQDLYIPVRQRAEAEEFSGWSVKQGVPHVEPPFAVLNAMVALRIHLDDCLEDNGPLCVAPGTHTRRMPVAETGTIEPDAFVTCSARRGDLLCIKPLIVHRSGAARKPAHRRVLHVVYYAHKCLPGGLEWA